MKRQPIQRTGRNGRGHRVGSCSGRWATRLLFAACVAGALLLPSPVFAQRSQLPQVDYYRGFGQFYEADYKDAEQFYRRGERTTFKFGTRRFLDSVCYWTMLGECYYHVGNYAQAIKLYEDSLLLYLSYQSEGWQDRIQLPQLIQPSTTAVARAQITWFRSARNGNVANVPDTYQVLFGRLDADRVLQQGGVVQNAEIKQVDLNEIMRCLAICLHRRRQIKGPLAKYDPLTSKLVTGLSGSRGGNTILGAYNGVLLGIAQATQEDWSQATTTLKQALQFSRDLDHPLTPVALLELAEIAVRNGQPEVAGKLALEASFSAAVFNQFDFVEEAMAMGTTLHLQSSASPYPPLVNVIPWAKRNRARLLQASAIVRLAECLAEAGDAAQSLSVLKQSGMAINRRNSLGNAVVSARLKYVTALNEFSTGNFASGMSSLTAALQHFQNGSLWLYRLGLVESLVSSNTINARQADQLYGVLLRDPQDQDWKTDPFETIAFLVTPHVGPMERWFEILVNRRDYQRALEVSELVRRHRFFSTLPLGGRLMAFRWVMEAPEEALSDDSLRQRAQFLNRNLAYKQTSDESRVVLGQIEALPLQPDPNSDEARQRNQLMKQLAQLSATEEVILASNALRREPATLAFPPARAIAEIQSTIRPDQFALVATATFSGYHFFLINRESIQYTGLESGRAVERSIGGWLKQLGANEMAIDVDNLGDEEWKTASQALVEQLFPNTLPKDWDQFSELVVVPDGAVWYLPFEALLIGEDEDQNYLSERVNIRYSPTLALAFGAQRPIRNGKKTGVVLARMHPRGDAELAERQFDELVKEIPDAVPLTIGNDPAHLVAGFVDQLLVWSGIRPIQGNVYEFAPLQLGTEKRNGSLSDWMALPWQGPENLVVPGYQSAGLTMRGTALGNDMFLTSLGLMASGTRSILISRWASGGKSSLQLSQQYLEKLPVEGMAKAIAESRAAIRETELDFDQEPRLRSKTGDPPTKASHPFFWAGPMLLAVPDASTPKFEAPAAPGDSDDDNDGDK